MANPAQMHAIQRLDPISIDPVTGESLDPEDAWLDDEEDHQYPGLTEWIMGNESSGENSAVDIASILRRIPVESSQQQLLIPNYPEDIAVRHATLQPRSWRLDGEPPFYPHGSLDVQMRHQGATVPLDQAEKALEHCGERTLLTLRIALGLWNLRRADHRLCWNGAVAIRADEVLYWLGIKKHNKTTHSSRRTDGWRLEEYKVLEDDLRFATSLWISGNRQIKSRGKPAMVEVDGPYISATFCSGQTQGEHRRFYGLFLSPGAWINVYQEHQIYYLTPLSRRIFELHPQNDQHALRIALYLAERWRIVTAKRSYDTPVTMETLLRESAIAIPENNGGRFAARIEAALMTLQHRGIIGQYERTSSACERQNFRLSTWLASEWHITPPIDIIEALNCAVRPLPPRRRR